jgi:hypothetical protein
MQGVGQHRLRMCGRYLLLMARQHLHGLLANHWYWKAQYVVGLSYTWEQRIDGQEYVSTSYALVALSNVALL